MRPHLDYSDLIYDKPNHSHLSDKIENVQYSPALSTTGIITATSYEKLYEELGFKSLKYRRW